MSLRKYLCLDCRAVLGYVTDQGVLRRAPGIVARCERPGVWIITCACGGERRFVVERETLAA